MRTDNAFGYNSILNRARRVDELLGEALEESSDYGVIPILEARIENSDIKAFALEARTELEYTELLDENVELMSENYDLRTKVQKLTTELGDLEVKAATVETEPPIGWMSGGYNLLDIEEAAPPRMTMSEEKVVTADNNWPTWLSFRKGDLVRDTITNKEGIVTEWHDSLDRFRIIYVVECEDTIFPMEGLGEEFILIKSAEELEAEEVEVAVVPEPGEYFDDDPYFDIYD